MSGSDYFNSWLHEFDPFDLSGDDFDIASFHECWASRTPGCLAGPGEEAWAEGALEDVEAFDPQAAEIMRAAAEAWAAHQAQLERLVVHCRTKVPEPVSVSGLHDGPAEQERINAAVAQHIEQHRQFLGAEVALPPAAKIQAAGDLLRGGRLEDYAFFMSTKDYERMLDACAGEIPHVAASAPWPVTYERATQNARAQSLYSAGTSTDARAQMGKKEIEDKLDEIEQQIYRSHMQHAVTSITYGGRTILYDPVAAGALLPSAITYDPVAAEISDQDMLDWEANWETPTAPPVLPAPAPAVETICECGAHKATGAGRGSSQHSGWCPWKGAP